MGWFTKTAQPVRPQRSKEAIEDEMLRQLSAIPLARWDETLGGFAAVSDSGTTIELQYWRLCAEDGASYCDCTLLIDGRRIPVDGSKVERLYQTLSQRLAILRQGVA